MTRFTGTNLGKILQVVEGQIVIEETYESDNGEWEKRKVSVALPE
jgi:Tfp pilus assembly protein PilP